MQRYVKYSLIIGTRIVNCSSIHGDLTELRVWSTMRAAYKLHIYVLYILLASGFQACSFI